MNTTRLSPSNILSSSFSLHQPLIVVFLNRKVIFYLVHSDLLEVGDLPELVVALSPEALLQQLTRLPDQLQGALSRTVVELFD